MIDSKVAEEILEERIQVTIRVELSLLVDEGLLEMGVGVDGESVFWPTPLGRTVLGMEPEAETLSA